jgi:isoaspartyl peptidase/L-asparaginase-like protein (Ntn-hydrolase superfamily)
VIHGGAGANLGGGTKEGESRLRGGLDAALAAGWEVLEKGGGALAAAVAAVASMEDSGVFNAGRGAVTTSEGAVETDAAVMDGATGKAGAICAATWPANPVRAALVVAGLERASGGPVLLAGTGADRVARAAGLAELRSVTPGEGSGGSAGTVGAVVVDAAGHVAAATSTGGRPGQLPGRVGDSPLFGAGTWADDATVAISATGAGEAFILAGFAHRVDWNLRSHQSLERSLGTALGAVAHYGGAGGAIAVTPDGQFAVMFDTAAMARGWRDATQFEVRSAGP